MGGLSSPALLQTVLPEQQLSGSSVKIKQLLLHALEIVVFFPL